MFDKTNLRPSTMCSCWVLTSASIIEHLKAGPAFICKSVQFSHSATESSMSRIAGLLFSQKMMRWRWSVKCDGTGSDTSSNGAHERDIDKQEVKMTFLTRHKQLQPELWLSLEPRDKIHVCGSAECTQVWCGVYTPVGYKGIDIACKRNTLQLLISTMTMKNLMRW